MKKITFAFLMLFAVLVACNKSDSKGTEISLTASSTNATVGQTVAVSAKTNTNAISWTVNPSTNVNQTYTITTEKTNYFTFSKPGEYLIGVRARPIRLDSIHICNPSDSLHFHVQDSVWHHQVDSIWHHEGHHNGGCTRGKDSASIIIKVS